MRQRRPGGRHKFRRGAAYACANTCNLLPILPRGRIWCPRDVHLLRAKLYFVFGGGCIGLSSARRPTPLGVPTDLQSVVKKVRPIKPGDLQSPYPIDMLASTWVLGIANPQSIKRLGHCLTADCKSAGTPNGGKGYPALRKFSYFLFGRFRKKA